ncbi:hypothetical protein PAXINDRAFT_10148 [Paxillus involutus ATCC 200175]|nr:hypothetical protein PAXINDRAFT_10148 [Paxillus involutus ATCC 200175]
MDSTNATDCNVVSDKDDEWHPEDSYHTKHAEKFEATIYKEAVRSRTADSCIPEALCPPPGSSAHHVLSDEELLVFLSSSGDEGTDEDTKATLCQSKGKGKASDPHQPGPLPDEACRERYGKPVQHILGEAGLKKIATRGKRCWNLHQKWYAFTHPRSDNETVEKYRTWQKQHYLTHGDEEEERGL